MTKHIQVKILDHNLDGMPLFLAKLTQRGHLISDMNDLLNLYDDSVHNTPSSNLLTIPHSTIRRMNYMTIAVVGLSTKAVSQLRTHATRLTFLSTSTQYSAYVGRANNYVTPEGLDDKLDKAYEEIQNVYESLIEQGIDKDKAGYLLPQGLRKTLIISGNLDAWQYVLSLRSCRRNTEEVQHICRLIRNEIITMVGPEFLAGMYPSCVDGKCNEGRFSCGKPLTKEELNDK